MAANERAFVDTSFFISLVNERDVLHPGARAWAEKLTRERWELWTTEYVLVETGDGLSKLRFRRQATEVLRTTLTTPWIKVVPGDTRLLKAAFDLYQRRADKEWGLTDCISFVVMKRAKLNQALTCDRDFVQAGFRAPLLEEAD